MSKQSFGNYGKHLMVDPMVKESYFILIEKDGQNLNRTPLCRCSMSSKRKREIWPEGKFICPAEEST